MPTPKIPVLVTRTSNVNPLADERSFTTAGANTVMAEQVGHNVVNSPESTSGSPLVDAAATQAHTAPASNGTTLPFKSDITPNESLLPTNEPSVDLSNPNATRASATSESNKAAVEPSAGDAAAAVVNTPSVTFSSAAPPSAQASLQSHSNGAVDVLGLAEAHLDDGRTPEGSVDISLNSDTEGSRADHSENSRDEKHHLRTSSIKKPTTFSKVSVTKNFMAKSAVALPSAPKLGDKPVPAGPASTIASIAKPRLIAKTGTSLRDIQKARLGAESTSGPDASKVWNKNRPTPTPPQKQFTDEELKQQYGIHLATRFQTDENDKESKWADIDDDEDDWAPEAVVWMDGTKSSLTAQEATTPEKEAKADTPQQAKPVEGVKPVPTILKPTEIGPQKKILKPGANAAAALQAKQNGGSLGTPGEKASLKAKSPALAPTKSPWATLPPVEKISPVNPPVQQPQAPTFASQDARAYEPTPTPPQPAREIAADTFDRSWREGEGGARELFNSANGRYEPVAEGRRGSIRPDRKPAVLQRPSPSDATACELMSRAAAHPGDGPWVRRRGSSISQGSQLSGRRMSVSRPTDRVINEQRPIEDDENNGRPSDATANGPPPPIFAQQTSWQQQMPPRPESGQEQEDPVKVQERVMREKRELARKRRQEEEARLEVEKQERLKARLASLEGAGKSRKEREAEATAAGSAAPATSTTIATTTTTTITTAPFAETSSLTASEVITKAASETKTPKETIYPSAPATRVVQTTRPTPVAQQIPPAAPPAVAVYAQSAETQSLPSSKPAVSAEEQRTQPGSLAPKHSPVGLPERVNRVGEEQTQRTQPPPVSPRATARAPFQGQPGSAYRAPASSYSSPSDRKQQTFGRSPLPNNDTFSPWPTTAPSGNVWGTSGIGNGTFDGGNGFSTLLASSSLPPPPSMQVNRPATSARISPQGLGQESRSPNMQHQATPEVSRGFAPPGLDSLPDSFSNQSRVNGTSPAPGLGRQAHLPGPIAPPSRLLQHQQQQQQTQSQPPHRADAINAWNTAAQRLPYQYKAEAEAAERQSDETAPPEPRREVIKETFRQTSAHQGRLGGPRRYEKTEYTLHDAQGSHSVPSHSPIPPHAQMQASNPAPVPVPIPSASPIPHENWRSSEQHTGRPQELPFHTAPGPVHTGPPMPRHAIRNAYQGNSTAPAALSMTVPPPGHDDAPPPPETASHPVNSGDSSHPLVKLPPGRVVVKLPPAAAESTHMAPHIGTVTMPPRPISNRGPTGAMQPLVANETWQARFNGLFKRTNVSTETPPSPPKTPPKAQGPALVVAASTRAVMEDMTGRRSATVSLPQAKRNSTVEGFIIDDSADTVSKPNWEQAFKEERSFGSMPAIKITRHPSYARYVYGPMKGIAWNMYLPAALVQAQSAATFDVAGVHLHLHEGFVVRVPGGLAKVVKPRFSHVNMGVRRPNQQPRGHDHHRPTGRHHNNNNNNNKPRGREGGMMSPGGNSGSANITQSSEGKSPVPKHSAPSSNNPVASSTRKASHTPRAPRGPAHKAPTVNPV